MRGGSVVEKILDLKCRNYKTLGIREFLISRDYIFNDIVLTINEFLL